MASANKQPSCDYSDLVQVGMLPVTVGNQVIGFVKPKEFSTGSYGLSFTGAVNLVLPTGKPAIMQASINMTVKHSKPAEAVNEAA